MSPCLIINSLFLKESHQEVSHEAGDFPEQSALGGTARLPGCGSAPGAAGEQKGCLILPGVEACSHLEPTSFPGGGQSHQLLPPSSALMGLLGLGEDPFHLTGSDPWPLVGSVRKHPEA